MKTIHTRRLFLTLAVISGTAGLLSLFAAQSGLAACPLISCLFSLSIAFDPGFVLQDVKSIFGKAAAAQSPDIFPVASQAFFYCALLTGAWVIIR